MAVICQWLIQCGLQDVDAQFVSLESIIDRDFEKLDQEFYDYLSQKMAQAVEQCGNKVPVVTGNWLYVRLQL